MREQINQFLFFCSLEAFQSRPSTPTRRAMQVPEIRERDTMAEGFLLFLINSAQTEAAVETRTYLWPCMTTMQEQTRILVLKKETVWKFSTTPRETGGLPEVYPTARKVIYQATMSPSLKASRLNRKLRTKETESVFFLQNFVKYRGFRGLRCCPFLTPVQVFFLFAEVSEVLFSLPCVFSNVTTFSVKTVL